VSTTNLGLSEYVSAHKKLARIAGGHDEDQLTPKEARALIEHMDWLSSERDRLFTQEDD